jgi:HAMP domain-containing protein
LPRRREGGARRNDLAGVNLRDKILLVSAMILAVLVCVLTGLSALSLKQFSLYTAERHARSVAETVKVGLTESMINGTIKMRQQFLLRLAGIPGVSEVRVARGPAVIAQFGPGLASENASHHDVKDVLSTGRDIFELVEINGEPVFHAVIPYVASDQGVPNCLQCHAVRVGTVLGAVQVDIPFSEVRHKGRIAVGLVGLAVLVAALAALALLQKLLRPLSETAEAVRDVTSLAVEGDFSGRVLQRSSDEVGGIALNINQLMDFLQREVGTIRKRVGELMGFSSDGRGNQLAHTTELVEGLVQASQFKQAIEEDQTKVEIYQRLADLMRGKVRCPALLDLRSGALQEPHDGHVDRWRSRRDLPPLRSAGDGGREFCRARRTGHEVNAVAFPGLCTMFRPGAEGDTHVCLPINQSGSAGAIVQMVTSREEGDLASRLVPFVSVYLREAGSGARSQAPDGASARKFPARPDDRPLQPALPRGLRRRPGQQQPATQECFLGADAGPRLLQAGE